MFREKCDHMSKFNWASFIESFAEQFPDQQGDLPWAVAERAREIVKNKLKGLNKQQYKIAGEVAVHKSAVLEINVTLKGPIIIGPACFVATGCYLRDGVLLLGNNSLGPGCEIKSSILFAFSNLAHFNFVGDSVIGSNVNFEAGSVIANHFNERKDKTINAVMKKEVVNTLVEKFGALVGDGSKIGANAVLSPGTILTPNSVVNRLQLVDQMANI
jgi:NDP-sugar pyrophosphorylase family protein